MSGLARSSWGRVFDDLGVTLLEVVHGRIDVDRHIGGVVIHDPIDPPVYPADAVVLATGNDTRAVEAGCHSHAARAGGYTALSQFEKDADGNLVGTLEVPLAVGLVGGATRAHPTAQASVKLLGVETARELASVIAAVGLAQNLAACRALAAEGIQRGHMTLHARTIAASAGADVDEIGAVAARIVADRRIRVEYAREVLAELRGGGAGA